MTRVDLTAEEQDANELRRLQDLCVVAERLLNDARHNLMADPKGSYQRMRMHGDIARSLVIAACAVLERV